MNIFKAAMKNEISPTVELMGSIIEIKIIKMAAKYNSSLNIPVDFNKISVM